MELGEKKKIYMERKSRADQEGCYVWVNYQKSPRQSLYGGFLGIEIKEMDLNRYLVCLLLACCIYSVTGRVGSFGGGLDVLKSLFLIFFLIWDVLYPSVKGPYALLVQMWYG